MADWKNRKKIHIAGGPAANIVKSTEYQGARQPVFISDKNYLTVGPLKSGLDSTVTGGRDDRVLKNVAPIKVRTVEGYNSDAETDSAFTLSTDNTNHYIFTGRGDKVYLKTTPNFYLYRQVDAGGDITSNDKLVLSLQNDNSLLINPSFYLQSANIRTTNINDTSNKAGIQFNGEGKIILQKPTSTNLAFESTLSTTLKGTTNIEGTLNLKANTNLTGSITTSTLHLNPNNTETDKADIWASIGKIDTLNTTRGTITTLSSTNTTIGSTLAVGPTNSEYLKVNNNDGIVITKNIKATNSSKNLTLTVNKIVLEV